MLYGEVWTLSESGENALSRVSYELLSRGRMLADKLQVKLCAVVLCGNNFDTGADAENDIQQLIKRGADKVYIVQARQLEHFITETYSNVISALIKRFVPEIFIAAATSTGRVLMPHIAARLNTGLTADCTGLDIEPETGSLLQTRPAIGGNIMATIKTPAHRPQMATVRPRSSAPAPLDENRKGEIVRVNFEPDYEDKRVSRTGFRKIDESGADIQSAEVVVAGGKGLKKKESFASVVNSLADSLGGVVGASRDVVDRGWAEYPHQVGLSGKTVAPKLYVALGISGSVQHLAGMKTSENIVAVNSDPEAQIFKTADFGIAGDLFDVVPVLIEKINERKSRRQ